MLLFYYLLTALFVFVGYYFYKNIDGLINAYLMSTNYNNFFMDLDMKNSSKPLESIHFKLGLTDAYLIRDPSKVKKVYNDKHFDRISSVFTGPMKKVIGTNIITADHSLWENLRPIYESYFNKSNLDIFYRTTKSVIEDRLHNVIKNIGYGKKISVFELSNKIAGLAAICSFFGLEPQDVDDNIVNDTVLVFELIRDNTMSLLPMVPLWVPIKRNVLALEARTRIYNFINNIINLKINLQNDNSVLYDIIKRNPNKRQRIIEEAVSFIIGGLETTAIVLSWIMYYLAKNKELQHEVRNECKNLDINIPDSKRKMKLTHNVIYEVLRLHPPATVSCFFVLDGEDGKLMGNVMKPGSMVFMSQYVNHRSPFLWKDPSKFDPHRYDDGSETTSNLHPFGGGRTVCVGKEFSIQEAKILTASILNSYEINLVSGTSEMDIKVTARPKENIAVELIKLD